MYETIRYEKQEGIGVLTISRPKALNALNAAVIGELETALTEIEQDTELRALIITGEGRAFVAGADIAEQCPMDIAQGRKWGQRGSAVMRRIEKLEIPTIAAVNGFALGGGCELAMSCDSSSSLPGFTNFVISSSPPARTPKARAARSSDSPKSAWASRRVSPAHSASRAAWARPRPRS